MINEPLLLSGRQFSFEEIAWLKETLSREPGICREALARSFCRFAKWYRLDGSLKTMSCKRALFKLEEMGILKLPASRHRASVRGKPQRTALCDPQAETYFDASALDLSFERVTPKRSLVWNEMIDRYHYLGYCTLAGAQIRYFVRAGERLLALLGFSSAAWKVAARDAFIGWSPQQRQRNLHRVVNNSRFLILPWIHCKNLASKILARAARILPDDWDQRYGYRPLLLETFVEKDRFAGTSYRAANWFCVGDTTGRGKWDRYHRQDQPIKSIWLYPLVPHVQRMLCDE